MEVRTGREGRLSVHFAYADDLIARIKQIPGSKWNDRDRRWTIPAHCAALALFVSRFRSEDLFLASEVERLLPKTGLEHAPWRLLDHHERILRDGQHEALRRMHEELTLRGYSHRTRKIYVNQTRRFLRFACTEPSELNVAQVRSYVRTLLDDRGLSHSYADQNVSALKFFFERVLGRPLNGLDLPRPKRQRKLPSVLSQAEVLRLFDTIENRKHRAILMLVYAAGLRVGEVVRLKMGDIDPDREMLHIRQGKGRKDRCAPLSKVALAALRTYLRYRPAPPPGPWIFPGQRPGRHLSERTVQQVFARARTRARIEKPATVHTLRHSFATHLHEGGIGLRYIQALLGHKSPQTTEIYTHVSQSSLANVQSPLDRIMRPDPEPDLGDGE